MFCLFYRGIPILGRSPRLVICHGKKNDKPLLPDHTVTEEAPV
jgi:hypothetical protein